MGKLSTSSNSYQWFIISAIGFKEKMIANNLIEKLKTYGYYGPESDVREIKIIETESVVSVDYAQDDKTLPRNLRDTSTITWQTLPNGKVRKTTKRLTNRYPSYIFINMNYSPDLWYVIRNTQGVLGIIGSSGKGKAPTPISIESYERLHKQKDNESDTKTVNNVELLVNNHVKVLRGQFADAIGVIKNIDQINKIAKVAVDAFGRDQIVDVDFADLLKV